MLAQGVYWSISSHKRLAKYIAIKNTQSLLRTQTFIPVTGNGIKQLKCGWSKPLHSSLGLLTVQTPLQMSMDVWIYQGKLLKLKVTSATALREKGHTRRWAGGGKPSLEADGKLPGHRHCKTLKSSIKCTIDNTVMSCRSFYNSHREQNVQERGRNCARRHDHHIIPGYWSGYQKYLAKSALCAENCARTWDSSLKS